MRHIFRLTDEQYAQLVTYAARRKQTPESLFQTWLSEVTHIEKESTVASQTEQVKHEEDIVNSPIFQVAGMFAIGEPGWADKHDEYLAEGYMENHANKL